MANFHASDELLMEYAAGALAEPIAVLVATHMALCPQCRSRVETYEAVGGAMFEDLDGDPTDASMLENVLARLDDEEPEPVLPVRPQDPATVDVRVPNPLRSYLGGGLDDLKWKSRGSLDEVRILPEYAGTTSRLFRIPAGAAMPQHTHDGTELTLVLTGGFTDRNGHYLRGDVAAADPTVDHRPIADAGEDCFCFAVNDAPLRLTGRFGRLLNPFIRM